METSCSGGVQCDWDWDPITFFSIEKSDWFLLRPQHLLNHVSQRNLLDVVQGCCALPAWSTLKATSLELALMWFPWPEKEPARTSLIHSWMKKTRGEWTVVASGWINAQRTWQEERNLTRVWVFYHSAEETRQMWDLKHSPDVFAQGQVIQPQSWQENNAVCPLLYRQQANIDCWLSQLVGCAQKTVCVTQWAKGRGSEGAPCPVLRESLSSNEEEDREALHGRRSDSAAIK